MSVFVMSCFRVGNTEDGFKMAASHCPRVKGNTKANGKTYDLNEARGYTTVFTN